MFCPRIIFLVFKTVKIEEKIDNNTIIESRQDLQILLEKRTTLHLFLDCVPEESRRTDQRPVYGDNNKKNEISTPNNYWDDTNSFQNYTMKHKYVSIYVNPGDSSEEYRATATQNQALLLQFLLQVGFIQWGS